MRDQKRGLILTRGTTRGFVGARDWSLLKLPNDALRGGGGGAGGAFGTEVDEVGSGGGVGTLWAGIV